MICGTECERDALWITLAVLRTGVLSGLDYVDAQTEMPIAHHSLDIPWGEHRFAVAGPWTAAAVDEYRVDTCFDVCPGRGTIEVRFPPKWASGAVGSAREWHSRGHRFDPGLVHQTSISGLDFPQVAERRRSYAGSNKAISVERDSVRKEQLLEPLPLFE